MPTPRVKSVQAGRRPRVPASARRQQGLGLLETMFLVLLIGGLLLAAFFHLREQAPTQQAEAQASALSWADRALIGFAAANARLPCPASRPDGPEDCATGDAKGWLPVATLSLHNANPGPGSLPMGYVAYRGPGGSDLVQLTDQFNPHGWDGNIYAEFGALNGLDFCVALGGAKANPASIEQAYFRNDDGINVNVAYGIVAASALGGSGSSLFDGLNIGSGAALESPTRGLSAGYGDRVRVRDFDSLSSALSCGHMLASLDGMALAADVIDEVYEQKASLQDAALQASILNAVGVAMSIVDVVMSGIALGAAVVALGAAIAELAAAIVGCIFLVGCAFIPTATAAVATAAAGVVAAGVAIGLAIAALVMQSIATAQTILVAIKAGGDFVPLSADDLDKAVDAALKGAQDADQAVAKARTDYANAVNARNQADLAQQNAWNSLRAPFLAAFPDDGALLDTYRARAMDMFTAVKAAEAAKSARLAIQQRITDLNTALVEARQRHQAKIAECQSLPPGPDLRICEYERDAAADAITALGEQLASTQNDLAPAQAAEAAANQAAANAKTARNNAANAVYDRVAGNFLLALMMPNLLSDFESKYEKFIVKSDGAVLQADALREAEAQAEEAWNGYYTLRDIQLGNPPSGSEIELGGGQLEILEAADARGAVR